MGRRSEKIEKMPTMDVTRGRWRELLPQLGVAKKFLTNRNGPCPACGGKDRFRFDDRNKDGDYFCNQCGAGKGIGLVMKVRGWTFAQAARAIDELIGNKAISVETDAASEAARAFFDSCPDLPEPYEPVKSVREATLWLRRYQPLKLPEWLMQHEPMLTVWIERERPFGHWPSDKRFVCEGSLVNIKLKQPEAVR